MPVIIKMTDSVKHRISFFASLLVSVLTQQKDNPQERRLPFLDLSEISD